MKDYSRIAGLSWPKHKRIVCAHYTMDQRLGNVVFDESGNKLNGTLRGNPQWVEVRISKNTFEFQNEGAHDPVTGYLLDFNTLR